MAVSKMVENAMESGAWIRRMYEVGIARKAQFGEERVFDLSLGNPVVDPPRQFDEEIRRLIDNPLKGMHRYMPNSGYPETRGAVADNLTVESGIAFSANDIVMTCGAGAGLNVVLRTIVNPGEEVILLSPFFGLYVYMVENHNGVPVTVSTSPDFQLDLEAIEAAISPRTRAIFLNSPNNPSGVLYPESSIRELGNLLRLKQTEYQSEIFLVSDEPYRRILFDGISYPMAFPHYENTVVVYSHSKDLGLPGERIGYIAVNPAYPERQQLVEGFSFCTNSLGFVNAPALMQHVVRNLQGVTVDVSDYQRKRDYLYTELSNIGYSVVKPQGAFYLFPQSPIEDDVAFVEELQQWNVLTVPGTGFGTPGHFRISYCVDDWVLEGAVEGFAQAWDRSQ